VSKKPPLSPKAKTSKKVTTKKPSPSATSKKPVSKKKTPKKTTPKKGAPATKDSAPAKKPTPAKKSKAPPKATAKTTPKTSAAKPPAKAAPRKVVRKPLPGPRLLAAAERATKGALRVKPAERIVLVTDKQKTSIAEAFIHWFHHIRAETTTYLMLESIRPIEKLTRQLRAMVEEADLTLYMLEDRAEEKEFRRELVTSALVNGRVCMMPGITEDMMERLVNLNYGDLQILGRKVVELMSGAREVRVTNEHGTDVRFSVFGRRWLNEDGDIGHKGSHGNLPAGECFTSPVEPSFHGEIHFSIIDDQVGKGMARFEKGKVVEYKGKGITRIMDLIGRDTSGKTIGEIGIGTNKNARVGSKLLESEKACGTVHFALGDSYGLGPNQSKHHYDMLVEKATVIADGQVILKDGGFQI